LGPVPQAATTLLPSLEDCGNLRNRYVRGVLVHRKIAGSVVIVFLHR
jgi:hypothetical protein